MALRSRTALVKIENQENVKAKSKGTLSSVTLKRSALGEIGNKVNSVRGTGPGLKSNQLLDLQKKPGAKPLASIKPTEQKTQVPLVKSPVKCTEPLSQAQIRPVIAPSLQTDLGEKVSFGSDLLIEDIDQDDAKNPILVSIYTNDIYAHLRSLEKQTPILSDFLSGQHVTPKMRSVLVDWLVEVHQQFHLTQETLYLSVAILDRFLQAYRTIDRKRLQLVGITAMFVASKYEEMYSPDINDFVYITDNAYTRVEVLQMEMVILRTLNFSLGRPLSLQFLRRYSKAGKAVTLHHTMAKYFLEQSLVHYELCHYPPSLIAAAALYLSFFLIGHTQCGEEKKFVWTPTLVHYSLYKEEDILNVVREMALMLVTLDKSKHQAVRKKYTQAKYMKISLRSELKSPMLMKLATSESED